MLISMDLIGYKRVGNITMNTHYRYQNNILRLCSTGMAKIIRTHIMLDEFAVQYFGTTVDYWVSREPGNNWCGITAGAVRYCIENFHLDSVPVYVESEVHGTTLNPMNSTFNEVRYKDPDNGVWRLFDDQVIWIEQFPYTYEAYSYSHFRTYRVNTHENIYIPIGFK